MRCVKIFEICLPRDSKCFNYTSVEPGVLIDKCLLYVEPGWPRLLCVSLWKQTEGFHLFTLVFYTRRISQPCFSCFPGSLWGCCRRNAGTLSVHGTGRDRRENGGPENICQNRWAFKKSYQSMEHALSTSPIKMFLSSPLFSYNHRRDRFSGLCSLRPFLQTRRWNQLKRERLGFSL